MVYLNMVPYLCGLPLFSTNFANRSFLLHWQPIFLFSDYNHVFAFFHHWPNFLTGPCPVPFLNAGLEKKLLNLRRPAGLCKGKSTTEWIEGDLKASPAPLLLLVLNLRCKCNGQVRQPRRRQFGKIYICLHASTSLSGKKMAGDI